MAGKKQKKNGAKIEAEKKKAEKKPEKAKKAEKKQKPGKKRAPLLVGVGASAGGIDAIGELLDHFDGDECCTMFIVQHQSRETERDVLSNLVKKHTEHQVSVAEDGEAYKPGRIYVAPPDKVLSLFDGRMQLEERQKSGASMLIDSFFRSLAQEAGGRCAAVVLTGSNTDGTLGARAIKERNGLVIAQDPETASFSTMPQSIVDEGLADLVLAPGDIAAHLSDFADKIDLVPPESGPEAETVPAGERDKLLALLKNRTGHDFSKYKENTVNRRIKRRMSVHRLERLKDYLAYVRENEDEAGKLFKDLLIGVTNFFRDQEAFEALKKRLVEDYLPGLERKSFRAWVPGCATGEEAYSVAMVLREALDELDMDLDMDVYATDLDEYSIDSARKGLFPVNIKDDVPGDRLKKFFTEEDGRYRVRSEIRESVVFAVQNVMYDPPFSRLDLVCCRNLLMYLKPEAQKKALSQFRYGLRSGGLLLLGASESVTALSEPFETLDKKHRIFKLREDMADTHLPGNQDMPEFRPSIPTGPHRREAPEGKAETGLKVAAERFLLRQAGPAALINRAGDVLYFHGRTGKYLEPAQGAPRSNILDMARKGLSYDLSTALSTAAAKNEVQLRIGVRVQTNDHEESVDLRVTPAHLEECGEPCFMVSFAKSPERPKSSVQLKDNGFSEEAGAHIRELENELMHCREDMQAMIEEYEAANEELKSSNEELQSTNEELKSTNEELETAKEELQSINEEQSTLNQELQSKNRELAGVNDDMKNLLAGTRVATLFLDDDLRIRRFTPAMQDIMGLRDSDEGRPVGEMHMKLDYEDLEDDAGKVQENLNTVQREVASRDGKWYQLRIVPYRTTDNVIDGVVATFNDITDLKRKEQAAQAAKRFAESVVDTVNEPLLILDGKLRVDTVNKAFLERFQTPREETEGKLLYDLGNRQWDIPELRKILEEVLPEKTEIEDFVVEHDFPSIGKMRMHLNARAVPMEEEEEEEEKKKRILLAVTRVDDI